MKPLLVVAGLVCAGLGAICLRVVLEGRAALAAGDDALARGATSEAIAAWETAARWYLPLAPHVDAAYTRLAAVRPEAALAAARAIRAAARATRSHADELAAVDATIARLAAADPEGSSAAGETVADRQAWHAAQLARDPRPGTGAAALAIAGLVAWLAGIGLLAGRGLDPAGRMVRRPALAAAAVTVTGLAGWAAGLYNA